jgi:low temperature requirement protein LtrA
MVTPEAGEERHATWLELFFDLVIVAAVAQLAHLLHAGITAEKVLIFGFAYYAMWSVWTAFTLYANVSGARTRQRAMLAAMFGIAVMAASIPLLEHHRPHAFVWAYVYCRILSVMSWKRQNRVMTEWPGVQQSIGVLPWIASLGFPEARLWLWGLGVALDILTSIARSRDPQSLVAEERRDRERKHRIWLNRSRRGTEPDVDVQAAQPDRPHLGERLGLFVIIVLGEAVAQLVNAAAGVENWRQGLWLVVVLGFGLLTALWWLTLRYGATAAPQYGMPVFALRITMPAHYLTTVAIVAIAAGLGALAAHPEGHVEPTDRIVLCAGATLYFLVATVLGARGGASWRWVAGWGLPAVLLCAATGAFGGFLPAGGLLAVVLAAALWHAAYRRVAGIATRTAQ